MLVAYYAIFAYCLLNSYQETIESNYYIQDNDIIENKYQFGNFTYKNAKNKNPGRFGVTQSMINEYIHITGPLVALLFSMTLTIDQIDYPTV